MFDPFHTWNDTAWEAIENHVDETFDLGNLEPFELPFKSMWDATEKEIIDHAKETVKRYIDSRRTR
jgi:hypothetical protein